MFDLPKGPFCQSCGMPIDKDEMLGTNGDGSLNNEYCKYCFQHGEWTNPSISFDEMKLKCINILAEKTKMPPFIATAIVSNHLPSLKRWKQ